MQIIDTHCHVHDPEFADKYDKPIEQIVTEAKEAGISTFISVGTGVSSSQLAVEFAKAHGTYASLALHPHEVSERTPAELKEDFKHIAKLAAEQHKEVVAIGECGLDYFYHKEADVQQAQQALFRQHLDLARTYDLPLIFHIRDAFDDFFKIIDEYNASGKQIRGVVHSFTAGVAELKGCLDRDFYLGINGIMTFTKNEDQLSAAKEIPQSRMVLETDAPFLTPTPYRGKMCEIHHIVQTAKFMATLRNESLQELAAYTTVNAQNLFGI